MIRSIALIGLTTFREAVRAKITAVLVAFVVFCLLLAVIVANLTLGWPIRIVADVALTATSIVSTTIALVLGIASTAREIDRRTALYILARPIQRSAFILGKFAGIGAAATAILFPLAGLVAILLAIFSHSGGIYFPLASFAGLIALIWIRTIVVCAVAVATGASVAPTISAIMTLTVAFGGYFSHGARTLLSQQGWSSAFLGEVIYHLLPDFAALDGLARMVHGQSVWTRVTTSAAIHALCYVAFVQLVGCLVFRRRELS